VLLEAMLHSKAIIASDLPGIRECVFSDNCAMLVDPGDKDQLVRAIETLVADGGQRKALGKKANAAIQAHDFKKELEATCALYEKNIMQPAFSANTSFVKGEQYAS